MTDKQINTMDKYSIDMQHGYVSHRAEAYLDDDGNVQYQTVITRDGVKSVSRAIHIVYHKVDKQINTAICAVCFVCATAAIGVAVTKQFIEFIF